MEEPDSPESDYDKTVKQEDEDISQASPEPKHASKISKKEQPVEEDSSDLSPEKDESSDMTSEDELEEMAQKQKSQAHKQEPEDDSSDEDDYTSSDEDDEQQYEEEESDIRRSERLSEFKHIEGSEDELEEEKEKTVW